MSGILFGKRVFKLKASYEIILDLEWALQPIIGVRRKERRGILKTQGGSHMKTRAEVGITQLQSK